MPPCTNDSSRQFTGTEPSPKGLGVCAHAEKAGTEMRGADDRIWRVVTDKSGRKAWKHAIPSSLDKMSYIYTWANSGGFHVYFVDPPETPGRVDIYAQGPLDPYEEYDYDEAIMMDKRQYHTKNVASWSSGARVILGKFQRKKKFRWPWQSSESPDPRQSYDSKHKYDGNTLLIQPSEGIGKYVYVGHKVYSFTTPGKTPILEYYSHADAADSVSYAIAITATHAICMNEETAHELKKIPESVRSTEHDRGDLYPWLYSQHGIKIRTKTLAEID